MEIYELRADHLAFYYDEHSILRDASFTVKRGERIAIAGENSTERTMLLNIILRLHDSEGGGIFFDDQDTEKMELELYRSQFSVVAQFPYLFQDTIRDNLDPFFHYTDKELISFFRRFHMDDVYKRLPDGLDTPINVDGTNLSGGEKQKLAFLCGVLKRAPFLILDECTSGYDKESEEWLFTQGLGLLHDTGIIFVTHQSQYLNCFDRVYQLKNGRLMEIAV